MYNSLAFWSVLRLRKREIGQQFEGRERISSLVLRRFSQSWPNSHKIVKHVNLQSLEHLLQAKLFTRPQPFVRAHVTIARAHGRASVVFEGKNADTGRKIFHCQDLLRRQSLCSRRTESTSFWIWTLLREFTHQAVNFGLSLCSIQWEGHWPMQKVSWPSMGNSDMFAFLKSWAMPVGLCYLQPLHPCPHLWSFWCFMENGSCYVAWTQPLLAGAE